MASNVLTQGGPWPYHKVLRGTITPHTAREAQQGARRHKEMSCRTGFNKSYLVCFYWVPFPGFLWEYQYFPAGPWGALFDPLQSPWLAQPGSSHRGALRGRAAGVPQGRPAPQPCRCPPRSPCPRKGHHHSLPPPGSPWGLTSSSPHSCSSPQHSGCWTGCRGRLASVWAPPTSQHRSDSAPGVSASWASGNSGRMSAQETHSDVLVLWQASDELEERS